MPDETRLTMRGYIRALHRVGRGLNRLRWAVAFGAQDINALSRKRRRDLKEEMLAFISLTMIGPGETVELPSDEDLLATHERFRDIIRSLVKQDHAVIAHGWVTVGRNARKAWTTRR
jgi:hypothetical protein